MVKVPVDMLINASHIPVWTGPVRTMPMPSGYLAENDPVTLFSEDENIETAAAQERKICRGFGDEGLRRLNASGLSDEGKKKPLQYIVGFFRQTT